MCTNYKPTSRELVTNYFRASLEDSATWPDETYQDYPAPIILPDDDIAGGSGRKAMVASYAMVPKQRIPPGVKRFSTMNARSETIGQLRSYSSAWKNGQLCLVPMTVFFEPNWEGGAHVRWQIGMADGAPFAVAGLWRAWEGADGAKEYSFTQLTINADEHGLMQRFHRAGDEKRSLVIIPEADYDDWLHCRDPEMARSFLRPYPPELMAASAAPKPPRAAKKEAEETPPCPVVSVPAAQGMLDL